MSSAPGSNCPKILVVVTSIHDYTEAVLRWARIDTYHVVFVADRKTPALEPREDITVLSLAEQEHLDFELSGHLPYDHYARKNLGYLYAIQKGARRIVDTDDDNYPTGAWKEVLGYEGPIRKVSATESAPGQVNVYLHFTDRFIWPRGLPLGATRSTGRTANLRSSDAKVSIWQGLVDGNPDVDAIYRLLFGADISLVFPKALPLVLDSGAYCPFNSQNTMWKPEAFPLLYLPATVSFRYTDILRSFVAQRCLWAADRRLGFCSGTAYQKRNEHDLMKDFEDEVQCYLTAEQALRVLDPLRLTGNLLEDLRICYVALYGARIVDQAELRILEAWSADIRRHMHQGMPRE